MNLTPSQRLLFNLLQDGQPHSKDEMRLVLGDSLMEDNAIHVHICVLRRKIRREGYDIVSRTPHYQMVRLLHSTYDGKR